MSELWFWGWRIGLALLGFATLAAVVDWSIWLWDAEAGDHWPCFDRYCGKSADCRRHQEGEEGA